MLWLLWMLWHLVTDPVRNWWRDCEPRGSQCDGCDCEDVCENKA